MINIVNSEIKIVQIIKTVQGEGKYSGIPCIMIRFKGCNLKCPWCDTKWANDSDGEYILSSETEQSIISTIIELSKNETGIQVIDHIVITGGEPLIHINNIHFQTFIEDLKIKFKIVQFETNGSLFMNIIKSKLFMGPGYHFNISPKLDEICYPSHNMHNKCLTDLISLHNVDSLHRFERDSYDIKFVDDFTETGRLKILNFVKSIDINSTPDIYIMPLTDVRPENVDDLRDYKMQHIERCKKTLKFCLDYGFIFSPRIHIMMFDTECEYI